MSRPRRALSTSEPIVWHDLAIASRASTHFRGGAIAHIFVLIKPHLVSSRSQNRNFTSRFALFWWVKFRF